MTMLVSNSLKDSAQAEEKARAYPYSEDEKKQQDIWINQRMEKSWREMTTPLDEFDGMSLIDVCRENNLARNSFLTPIQNDGEVRVVTGTTEGKVDSIFHAVMNQNLELEISTLNQHNIEDALFSDAITDTVKATEQLEMSEDIEAEAMDEILTQPMVYIQDAMSDEWFYDRVLTKGNWDDLWQGKIPEFENRGWYRVQEPRKTIWTADQVFLANMRLPARLFQLQPYIILYRTRPLSELKRVYQHCKNWEFVKGGMPLRQQYRGQITSSDWRFSRSIGGDEGEEIIALSPSGDEEQRWIQGVPMLPVGCPYLANRFGRYNMTMEIFKPIHRNFGPGRPPVSMLRSLQALKDESFRLGILHYRQLIFQPIVTEAQKILSKDMWLPSAITYGVNKNEIHSLIDKQTAGIDQALQDMIEKEVEKFINVSPIFQGLNSNGQQTATEVANQMKQALLMLGHALVARIRMRRNCGYLRLYTILQSMLEPVQTRYNDFTKKSEEVYRTYSLRDADLPDGAVGTKIISFISRDLLAQEEDRVLEVSKESRLNGNPKSFLFIRADKVRTIPYRFFVNVYATEKRNSLIEKETFKQDIKDSIDLGRVLGIGVNPEYAVQEWSKRVKVDSRKLYQLPTAPMAVMPNEAGGGQMPGLGEMTKAGAGTSMETAPTK